MTQIFGALGNALRDLFQPRILAIVLVPMLAAIVIWSLLSWLFWGSWAGWLNGLLESTAVARWLEGWGASWALQSMTVLIAIVLLIPLVFITAMVVTEIVAMPVIVATVGGRYFAGLEKRRGGTLAGSIFNSVIAVAIFAALWIVTLPLWLFGIFALVLPVLLSAYLNQRLFRYDALAEHASAAEFARITRASRGDLFLLGILLSLLLYVPLVNLLVPVLSGLAFTHFCLGRLARERSKISK